ncbi:heavy metal translocating P-type ATPase [uncultured Enorma sp.]|uniref:heavy metal translocating P-type ATPase n=1 Tax=uncultured Enorma sp. TaxID=1714346 RepID=UPI0025E8669A|nr:heavy metal translocating P-type ATPase [uncultured Enorma sp.]
MRYVIEHEVPGRLRLTFADHLEASDALALEASLSSWTGVERVRSYPRIRSVAIWYRDALARTALLDRLNELSRVQLDVARAQAPTALAPAVPSAARSIIRLVGNHLIRRWLLPPALRAVWAGLHYLGFLRAGLTSLMRHRLDVPVLDATAIGLSFVKRDPKTAASTMFLLDLGEVLEDATRERSEHELIRSLMTIPQNARRLEDGEEVTVPAQSLRVGDLVVARTGMPVCVDGVVVRGAAMVNQAALTGEPLAVERMAGDDVFAGTAVEEGEIVIRVGAEPASTKLRSIVNLVEASEQLKSEIQTRREHLADRFVPWNFLLAGLVAATTKSLAKTSAALMVDYSCALRLTSSISVLAAMSQSAHEGMAVKGAKHFEAIAAADTIVFDKTGTLTEATPRVARVLALVPDWTEDEVLRTSACLEEHFPHPVARAVVAAAARGLEHRERHAEVAYIVAHGIASALDGKRIVIGSRHFVMEDEHVEVAPEAEARINGDLEGLSPLYLAQDGKLVGVLGIEDPLKAGVPEAIAALRSQGIGHIIMLTGDNERTAARIAAEAGITEYRADLLPEDKHAYVEALVARGQRVVMVGDGVNDAPALSAADVGIAMGTGTAIAQEVADVTLAADGLDAIVRLHALSRSLMGRLDRSFTAVMGINSALLAAGIVGIIRPQTSALLHNGTTIALAAESARRL